ncbi:hypothetical protein ACI3L1_15380 [Deinococcus sp. SM5_A1]
MTQRHHDSEDLLEKPGDTNLNDNVRDRKVVDANGAGDRRQLHGH